MYALVYWQDSCEISVISYDDVREGKDKDDISFAKWGKAWYAVDILKLNENREWLEALSVTSDGKLITPKRRSLISPDLLLKKRIDKKRKRKNMLAMRDATLKQSEKILNKSAIFESQTEEIHQKTEDNLESKDQDYFDGLAVPSTSSKNNCDLLSESSEIDHNTKNSLASISSLSFEDIMKIKELIQLTKHINVPKAITAKNKEMELVEGSGVLVDTFKATSIQEMYCKKPTLMARQLMKLILGEEKLRQSSPTGKNKWSPIPSDVYDAVLKFINENATKKKYTLTPQQYRVALTQMCATLRSLHKNQCKEKDKNEEIIRRDETEDLAVKSVDEMEYNSKENSKIKENIKKPEFQIVHEELNTLECFTALKEKDEKNKRKKRRHEKYPEGTYEKKKKL